MALFKKWAEIKKWAKFLTVFVFVAAIVLIFLLNKKDIVNITGIVGTAFSLIGIIITLSQIQSVENISKLTKEEVEKSLQKIFTSELTRANAYKQEIEIYLDKDNYEFVRLRINDLRRILREALNYKAMEGHTSELNECIACLSSCLRLITQPSQKKTNNRKIKISEYLQKVSKGIDSINGKLKYK